MQPVFLSAMPQGDRNPVTFLFVVVLTRVFRDQDVYIYIHGYVLHAVDRQGWGRGALKTLYFIVQVNVSFFQTDRFWFWAEKKLPWENNNNNSKIITEITVIGFGQR